mgnify:CR=1 FL=1
MLKNERSEISHGIMFHYLEVLHNYLDWHYVGIEI